MSIQNSFNSALSIASLLWSQSSKVAEVKETRRKEKIGKEFEAKRDAIIRSSISDPPEGNDVIDKLEHDAELYEQTGGVYRAEFEATSSLDALQNAKAFEKQGRVFRNQVASYRQAEQTQREREQARAEQDRLAAEQLAQQNEERERIRQMILQGGIGNG